MDTSTVTPLIASLKGGELEVYESHGGEDYLLHVGRIREVTVDEGHISLKLGALYVKSTTRPGWRVMDHSELFSLALDRFQLIAGQLHGTIRSERWTIRPYGQHQFSDHTLKNRPGP